jgi:ABC-type transporter Mla subunit MlaD
MAPIDLEFPHMPTLTESLEFLEECADADSNLEETAVKVATAVNDAHRDMELADSTSSTLTSAIDSIDPVVDVGAQIPVQPCTDLKPVARAMGRIKELLKKKIGPAIKALARNMGPFVDLAEQLLSPTAAPIASHPDIKRSLANARSVTDQLVRKFPGELPKEVREEAKRLTDAVDRARTVLESPLHDVKHILDGLHKMDPLADITDALAPIHDALAPTVRSLQQAAATFGHFLKPFNDGLKKINDAISVVRKKVEKEVEDAINSLLHKLHLKGDVFKAFEKEVQRAEDAIVHLLWTPVQTVTDRVNKELAREQQNVKDAVKSYIDLRATINRALQPLDDLLRAYVAAAAKVGIRPQ